MISQAEPRVHVYQCLGPPTSLGGRYHWLYGNVTQAILQGPYGLKANWNWKTYLKIDEVGNPKHWILVPAAHSREFELHSPGVLATVSRP